jgi:hypothetical protein
MMRLVLKDNAADSYKSSREKCLETSLLLVIVLQHGILVFCFYKNRDSGYKHKREVKV